MATLAISCDATSRYRVLSLFFDGVPPPVAMAPEGTAPGDGAAGAQSRQVGYRGHGPYAAKVCNACHESTLTNALVLPIDQLCFKCHEFKVDKKYVHGPLASGGCVACHDPHSSQYRYLLVSESDTFCFHCHDRDVVARVPAHAGTQEQCTICHDPHMSDKKYLLR